MTCLVIACSLNPESRSRVLAQAAHDSLKELGARTEWMDLADYSIPLCDGKSAYEDPQVKEIASRIQEAEGILLAVPIYNYDVNAAAKNLVELTGSGWEGKTVGFLCAAGGQGSYMSVMSLANSLMLDYRCLIVPRFVYATGEAFSDGKITDPEVRKRVADLAKELDRLCRALRM